MESKRFGRYMHEANLASVTSFTEAAFLAQLAQADALDRIAEGVGEAVELLREMLVIVTKEAAVEPFEPDPKAIDAIAARLGGEGSDGQG